MENTVASSPVGPALLLIGGLLACGCGPRDTAPPGEPASTERDPIFSERARESGIDFVHFNGMSGERYIAEIMGGGAALLDYDTDGDLDLYVTQGQLLGADKTIDDAIFPPADGPLSDRLFRNDLVTHADGSGEARFVDVTASSGIVPGAYAMGVASGDFDNDGHVDLYVTCLGPNRLLRNRGDGTFHDVTATSGTDDPRFSVPAVFFDYDRDGWLDLFVGNYVDFRYGNHRKCLSPSGVWDWCGPGAFNPQRNSLFHNRGDGTFENVTSQAGFDVDPGNTLGAVPGDFNGDGLLDLYVANDGMANRLWLNRGDGSFDESAMLGGCALNAEGRPEASMGVDAADFDDDGDEDLFMTHLRRETNTLYLNQGDGRFEDLTVRTGLGPGSLQYTGFGTGWVDYDNDGLLDLLTANGAVHMIDGPGADDDPFPLRQANLLYRNVGDGRFEDVSSAAGEAFRTAESSRGAAFGDVDNDGDVDVVLVNNAGPLRLLINEVGRERGWVGLHLVGGQPRREMIGAWAGLFVRGRSPLWRRSRTSGSYASAGDPRILFGLGDFREIERVVVFWPSGLREQFTELDPRSYNLRVEGEGEPLP